MSRPHGRARVSSRNPEAFAVCDRCGVIYNHTDLHWQHDWAGISLINKRMLVCNRCTDEPQQQMRTIILPADPVPVQNPRSFNYLKANTDYRTTSGQDTVDFFTGIPIPGQTIRVTSDNDPRVTIQTGSAAGSLNNEPGTVQPGTNPADIGLPRDNTTIPKVE